MKRLRKLRFSIGISAASLGKEVGISSQHILSFETTKNYPMKKNNIKKLAEFFNTTIEEITQELTEEEVEKMGRKPKNIIKTQKSYNKKVCKNQACLLNKGCYCDNDVVLSGKAPCFGQDLVKSKIDKINYKNTRVLFR